MRPVTLVLIAAGAVLAFGSAAVASFTVPVRSETAQGFGGSYSIIEQNLWGQSLKVSTFFEYKSETTDPPTFIECWESGPFRNVRREGRWTLKSREKGDPVWTEKIVWFLHGKEVSEDEWEKR